MGYDSRNLSQARTGPVLGFAGPIAARGRVELPRPGRGQINENGRRHFTDARAAFELAD